jgi:L-asparaginase II
MSRPDDFAPVAVTTRSGVDESVHFGAVVAVDRTGAVDWSVGDPDALVYPRSSNKPMQAVAMVRAGLDLPAELLALVCASHDGSPMHRDGAERILHGAGLTVADLGNTADLPLDPVEAEQILRSGGARTALQMNCSGKHAGMLATCVANRWDHDGSYLAIDHPLQQTITATIVELSGDDGCPVGVDGCGAPAHTMSLVGLARAFAAIASGQAGSAGKAVHHAMTAHPEMVGGPRRDVTALMRGVPGLMAKDGAEGVYAAALPDGRAVAMKVADGANRARPPVMLAALERMGVRVAHLGDALIEPIRGHGHAVGTVRSLIS